MQGLQAFGQGLCHGLGRLARGLAQARLHQRLHDGEHVLDAVIELADQHVLALRRAAALGDVAEDEHGAGERAVEAQDRRAAESSTGSSLPSRVTSRAPDSEPRPWRSRSALSAGSSIGLRVPSSMTRNTSQIGRPRASATVHPVSCSATLLSRQHAAGGVGGDHALADAGRAWWRAIRADRAARSAPRCGPGRRAARRRWWSRRRPRARRCSPRRTTRGSRRCRNRLASSA